MLLLTLTGATRDREGNQTVPGKQNGLIRLGVLGVPVYGVATLLATITHEPDPAVDFRAWAEYVTTTEFLLSHLFGSIVGMGIGLLAVIALYAVLAGDSGRRRIAVSGLIASVAGMVLVLPLFGAAAFGQPAIGRAYLDGVEAAVAIREDGCWRVQRHLTLRAGPG
jgi:hypothetical protein